MVIKEVRETFLSSLIIFNVSIFIRSSIENM